jgi:tetratricopeptide (TPR) repeat protein
MGLIESFKHWTGTGPSAAGSQSCPHEAEILKYRENGLDEGARARMEVHLTDCVDCRELVVQLIRFPGEEIETQATPSPAEIQQQTARIIRYIEEDEKRSASGGIESSEIRRSGWAHRGWLTATAALAFTLVVSGGYLWVSQDRSADEVTKSLRLAIEKQRPGPTRISGGFRFSSYTTTRGEKDASEFDLTLAQSQSLDGEMPGASAELRHARARVLLATPGEKNAERAAELLQGLISEGKKSADVYNDIGVARFELRNFDLAIENFSRALGIKPGFDEALFNRALAREEAKQVAEAIRDWQQFIDTASDPLWKKEAQIHVNSLKDPILPLR